MRDAVNLGFLMVFHPSDAYLEIKRRGKAISLIPPVVVMLLVLAVRYIHVAFVHAPLADIRLQDTSLILEIGRLLLPTLTVVVSIYAVSSILGGETSLKSIFFTVAYSFIPYVLVTPLTTAVSRVLSLGEGQFYFGASSLKWIWIVLLVFFAVMIQNNYSFKKTLGVAILSLIGVALIWAAAIMIISLSVQVATWFGEVFREITVSRY